MKLEISKQQFVLIQDEIIKLEEERPFLYESGDSWGIVSINDRINELKEIIQTEQIEI